MWRCSNNSLREIRPLNAFEYCTRCKLFSLKSMIFSPFTRWMNADETFHSLGISQSNAFIPDFTDFTSSCGMISFNISKDWTLPLPGRLLLIGKSLSRELWSWTEDHIFVP